MPSRSGLYATDLPGITTDLLDYIARATTEGWSDIWPVIYKRAYKNLVSDTGKNLGDKFFVDLKLVSRETSLFKATENHSSSLAGITLEFTLPRYAKLHVISVQVDAIGNYDTPGFELKFFDTDENGELLDTIDNSASGKTTINVDTDFEVDKLFIAYDPSRYRLKQTDNREFATPYNYFTPVVCDFCLWDNYYRGVVTQVNGGGLNVKYIIYCSAEKFVCENIKLFDQALLYKIGQEITIERRLGERLSEFTVMTKERWDELYQFYTDNYQLNLMNTINQSNIPEDTICYACKNTVRTETLLP
jgi:hypothetical protein